MSQVILYDLPSRPPSKGWSYNPWKTRMVLNFKGVDYKTEWIEYPDLVPTLKSYGLPPNDPNGPGYFTDYSSPAIRLADGTYLMESWQIVHALEKAYPSPPLHLEEPIVVQVRDHIPKLQKALGPNVVPKVPRNILNKRSADYFELTRAERYGKTLTLIETEDGGEKPWENARELIKEIAGWLKKNEGPFFLGETVSYADFILVTFLHFLKRVDPSVHERFLAQDPVFPKLFEASQPWLQKED